MDIKARKRKGKRKRKMGKEGGYLKEDKGEDGEKRGNEGSELKGEQKVRRKEEEK